MHFEIALAQGEAGTRTSAATPVTSVVPPSGSSSPTPVHRLRAAGLTPPRHSRDHGDFWGDKIRDRTLHLPCWADIHTPAHFSSISYKGCLLRNLKASDFQGESSPDIGKKLKKAEESPQTPQRDLLKLAFKIFNNWDEQAKLEKAHGDQAKYHLLATALSGSKPPSTSKERKPPGPCFVPKKVPGLLMPKPRPLQVRVPAVAERDIGRSTAQNPLQGSGHPLLVPSRSPPTQLCPASSDSPLKTEDAQAPRPRLSSPPRSPGYLLQWQFPSPRDLPDPGMESHLPCLLHCKWILYPLSHQGRLAPG
ncbi:uncharacterized protein LOC122452775 [Cervus canadensis]|uniref:uncharacterized protein LOC122452775 n=1 Tax=Cervus canadensis TaxID=1574408 RepID=UPI001C9E7394|nr:uncharacterized protein LOC122452775 [Cervus canadensis]